MVSFACLHMSFCDQTTASGALHLSIASSSRVPNCHLLQPFLSPTSPAMDPSSTAQSDTPSLFANIKPYRYEEFEVDAKAKTEMTDFFSVVAVVVPRGHFMELPTEMRHKIYDFISEPNPKRCGRMCFSKGDHITEVLTAPSSADFRRVYQGYECYMDETMFHETNTNLVGLEKVFSLRYGASSDNSFNSQLDKVKPILALNQEIRADFLAYLYVKNTVKICHCTARLYLSSWLHMIGSSIYTVRRLKLQAWVKSININANTTSSESAKALSGFRPTCVIDLWTAECHCYIAESWYNCNCDSCNNKRLSTDPQVAQELPAGRSSTGTLKCDSRCKTAVPEALASMVKNLNSQMGCVMKYVSEARASKTLDGRHMRLIVDAFFNWECKSNLCKHDTFGEHWQMAPSSKTFLYPDAGKYASEKNRIWTACSLLQIDLDYGCSDSVTLKPAPSVAITVTQLGKSAKYSFRLSWLVETLQGRLCCDHPSWLTANLNEYNGHSREASKEL